jgi:hypothetical protein
LRGVTLDANRLTDEEGQELAEIVKRFRELPAGAAPGTADVARYEQLVGQWAGDVNLFETTRRDAEREARMAQIEEKERLEALPKRPVYAETGAVTFPRFVFSWLEQSRDQAWTVADVGMLFAVLGMFENRRCLFANGLSPRRTASSF